MVSNKFLAKLNYCEIYQSDALFINPFKPKFTIVIFIHYKPLIAVAILDL